MAGPRRAAGAAAAVAVVLLAVAGCSAQPDPDGIVVENRSAVAVTVEPGDAVVERTGRNPAGTVDTPSTVVEPAPAGVTVEPGATGLVEADGCVWRDLVVRTTEGLVAELDGPACAGEVLRVPAEGAPYLEAMHG